MSVSSRVLLVPVVALVLLVALVTGTAAYLASASPLVGLIGSLVALAGAVAAAVLLLPAQARPAAPFAAPLPVPPPAPALADPDRGVLVQACIYVRDRVTSTALAARLDQAKLAAAAIARR